MTTRRIHENTLFVLMIIAGIAMTAVSVPELLTANLPVADEFVLLMTSVGGMALTYISYEALREGSSPTPTE